jgi:methylated-DNA-[protein]-cysteine S-methyltransferase
VGAVTAITEQGSGPMSAAVASETLIGTVWVEATDTGVRRVHLPGDLSPRSTNVSIRTQAIAADAAAQLGEYLRGEREEFEVALDWTSVSAGHRRVLETLREVAPFGQTLTYGELALQTGVADPREIGVMMSRNPVPLVVPCHRVVAADGLGGYGGGLELKRRLLELEGVLPPRLDLGDSSDR